MIDGQKVKQRVEVPPTGARVLVTGAGGFLGVPCCDRLGEAGEAAEMEDFAVEVHGVSRQPAAARQAAEPRPWMHWHQGDLLDPRDARRVVEEVAPSHLLHLAWASGAEGFKNSPENYRWLGPSLELLRAFQEVGGRRVVICGTGAEYHWSGEACQESRTPLRPELTYGLCKKSFFELSSRFFHQHGLSGAWGRLFFLYGPREEPRRLVASAILSLLEGGRARCDYSRLRRDYLHIEDAAEGLVRLLFSDLTGAVNLASGEAPGLGEIVEALARAAGRPDAVDLGGLPAPDSDGPPRTVVADVTRARNELGWRPRRTLDEGLAQTVDWWRRERDPKPRGERDHD